MGTESESTSWPTNFPSGEWLKDNVYEVQKDYTYVIRDSKFSQCSLSQYISSRILCILNKTYNFETSFCVLSI